MTDDDSQDIADARQSRSMALTLLLALAGRLLERMDEQDDLEMVVMIEKTPEHGNVEWHLRVEYRQGFDFVKLSGHPHWTSPQLFVDQEAFRQLQQNEGAAFDFQMPRTYVLAALRDSERVE